MRYFEDLQVGAPREVGTVTVSREDIVEFATAYDPQPMHVDPEAAREGPFGELVASGWHTASLCMRLLVDGFLSETATRGAIGVDDLRWRTPVRPGDELTVSADVTETEPWDEDRGLAHCRVTATNAEGDEAMSMVGLVLFARRSA
jgi:acyl dehydratase